MKILAFTSIRSDYDLLSPLLKLINEDMNHSLRLIVSGTHLSRDFGHSVDQIYSDGFDILLEVESLLASDSKASRLKSASILFQSIIDPIGRFRPDLMIFAGDREDVLIYSMIGAYLGIPTIHFYSGDHTKDGYVDNSARHAASKLASVHFVTLEEHKVRLIKMGEKSDRIHVVGNIALDRFVSFNPFSKKRLSEMFSVGEDWLANYCLVMFHPTNVEESKMGEGLENILYSLSELGIKAFVSSPNSDPNNSSIKKVLEAYNSNKNFIFFKNMERDTYLSLYKNANFIIGNSSSGVCEAASIPIPAINVGKRQQGRFAGINVVFVSTDKDQIVGAIKKIQSKDFSESVNRMKNPYGDGDSALKCLHLINQIHFADFVEKKEDPIEVNL